MQRKILTLLLCICLILQTASVLAVEPFDYTPGEVTFALDFAEMTAQDRVFVSEEGTLSVAAGGQASFDILFRENVVTAEITYQAAGEVTLTMTTENYTSETTLPPEETVVTVDHIERQGSRVLTLSADADVTISSVVFTKESKKTGRSNKIVTNYTDYQEALQSTVVIKENAVAVKVYGAMRYIDYEDVSVTPMKLDGRLYLPIHTAARAFSLYYEDYPDLNYVYLSNDNFELYAGLKGSYTIINGIKTEISDFAVYKEGRTWVPVRMLAELLELRVEYTDGIVLIDDRICVDTILESQEFLAQLREEFAPFDAGNAQTGRTYHVSKAAYASDEGNDGSENFPFATIQKAAEVAAAGDTVIVHEGVYRETVTPQNDGTATNPIIFRAAEGEEVTISAFEKLSGFTEYKNGIYQAVMPKSMGFDRNFIILDDEILREGRHPNSDTSTVNYPHPLYKDAAMRATMGDMRILSGSSKAESDIDLNQTQQDYWKGGTFVTLCGEGWTMSYAKIIGSEQGAIYLQDHERGSQAYGITYYGTKFETDYGFITNHLNTVDMPGEWYVGDNILYLIPPEGMKGEELTVEIKQRQRVVDLTDRRFVQFIDINTRGGGLTMAGDSEMCVLNGGTHKYISHVGWSTAADTHSLRFYDVNGRWTNKVDAPELGEAGFFAHGVNNAFINTDIQYSAAAGIYLTGLYTYVENNVVGHTSYAGTYASGITVEGVKWDKNDVPYGGHTVVGNTSFGAGRGTFYLSRNYDMPDPDARTALPVIGCDVSYNDFYLGSVTARDTGVTYTHGTTMGNDWVRTRFHHNVVHDQGTIAKNSLLNSTVYFDGQTAAGACYSNIAFNQYTGFQTSDDSQFHFANNGHFKGQIDNWSNKNLKIFPGGVEALKTEHYPYAKPFYAGAYDESKERFMLNYEQYDLKNTVLAGDALLQNGAVLDDDGFAVLPAAESSISADVELYEGGNKLQIFYASDRFRFSTDAIPKLTVRVTQNGEVVRTLHKELFVHGEKLDSISSTEFLLPDDTVGRVNLEISCSGDNFRFLKVRNNACDYEAESDGLQFPATSDVILLGSVDEMILGSGTPRFNFKTDDVNVEKYTHYSIHDTSNHTYIYKNRELTQDVSKLTMRVGSGLQWANVYIKVRVGSKTAEPIAVIDVMEKLAGETTLNAWRTMIYTVDLSEVLPAGTYDFYLSYEPYEHELASGACVTDGYYMAFH